jgi:hypothetical protein
MTQYKGLRPQTNKQTLQLECTSITKSLTRKKKSYMQLKQKHIVPIEEGIANL